MPPKKKATKKSRPIHSKRNQSKKAKLHKALVPFLNSKNLPATQEMLTLVQKQFKSDLMSLDKKTQARFDKIDAKFVEFDKRFDQIDIKFEKIDVEFANIRSQFSEVHSALAFMTSEISKISIFIERQDSRNRFALEGYEQVYSRHDRFEHQVNQRVQAVEEVIAAIPKNAPDPA